MWAGYSRVSRVGDRADTLISPDLQAERIKSYATARGLTVEILPPELDVSGGKVERPILSEAIRGVEQGRFHGIIVAQLDRLSRMSIIDALGTIRRVEEAGGQVIAVAENFDATTPEGRMARNVILSMAEMQLDRYKAQFSEAKRQAVVRGIWPFPLVPIGYRKRSDRRLEPNPATRGQVVRAFEQRTSGVSWAQIARALGWGQTKAAKVVGNRVYLGEIRLGPWVNVEAHEPLVDRALFEAAQLSHPRPARSGRERALLKGLARCAGCGCLMGLDSKDGYRYYRCARQVRAGGRKCPARAIISAAKLDDYVETVALQEADQVKVTGTESTAALGEARDRLAAAEAELSAYQRLTSVTALGEDAFLAGMAPRVEAVEQARTALAHARGRVAPLPDVGTLRELWEELSVDERRHVLGGLLAAAVVTRGRGPCEGRVRVLALGEGDLPVEIGPAGA